MFGLHKPFQLCNHSCDKCNINKEEWICNICMSGKYKHKVYSFEVINYIKNVRINNDV